MDTLPFASTVATLSLLDDHFTSFSSASIGIGLATNVKLSPTYIVPGLHAPPLFIIVLSVFFSVHYLVIYYLLQPYNKDLQVRSISYTFVSVITLVLTYILSNLVMSSLYFSILGIVLTGAYIIVSLKLVYKYAPSTFRIHA